MVESVSKSDDVRDRGRSSSSTAAEGCVVVGTVVVLSCRNACWCTFCVLVGYVCKINAFGASKDIEGWWGFVGGRIPGLRMHSPGKVTMVMMTLSVFPRREACRFCTGEFLGA